MHVTVRRLTSGVSGGQYRCYKTTPAHIPFSMEQYLLTGGVMQYGTVKKWDGSKGFGFIVSDDDDEFFVHVSDLHVSINDRRLRQGQRVGFDVRSDMKGDKAINVRILG
jgi:CspA family cold shock protein